MKKWIVATFCALAFALPIASFAQATPAKLELARQIIALQHGPEQEMLLTNMANYASLSVIDKWSERILDGNTIPQARLADVKAKLDEALMQLHAGILAALKEASAIVEREELANVYAENFTEDELKTMLAWFNSSAYAKFQQNASRLADVYMNSIMDRTKQAVQRLQGDFDAKAAAIVNAERR